MKLHAQILQKLCFSSSTISEVTAKQLTIQNQIKLGITPSIVDLNQFLSFLFHSEKFNLSLSFFSQITSNSIKPNCKSNSIVAEVLLKLHNGSKAADNVIVNMNNFGIKPESGILDSVIYKACLLEKEPDLSFSLMQEFVRNDGFSPSYYTLYTLISNLGYQGDIETALKVFDVMSERNEKYPYWNYVCSLLITRFSKIGKLEFCLRICEKIKKIDGFNPNLETYTTLIRALRKDNRNQEASDLVFEVENKRIKPDIGIYDALISELCKIGKMHEETEISHGIVTDNLDFTTLLRGFMKEKDESSIMELKTRIEDSGFKMYINTCNALIEALFVIGNINDAHDLFVEMPERGFIANDGTYHIMINGYKEIGEIDKLLDVFEEHIENCVNKEKRGDATFHIFIEISKGILPLDSNELLDSNLDQIRQNGAERVLNLVREIEKFENGLILSLIGNLAIVLSSMENYPNHGLEIYLLLRQKSLRITSNTSYLLIKSLLENKYEKYTIEALICDYIKFHPNFEYEMVNLISQYTEKFSDINDLLIKITKEGRIKEAYNLIDKNTENRVSIELSSYALVIDKLCKVGYIEKALDLCENMRNRGVYLNIIIYNSILNGLCKEGCLIEAFRLFKFLEGNDTNLEPTIYTYAPLISVICKEGLLEDAREVFDKMLEKDIAPNIFVVNLIINGFCQLGLVEEAIIFLSNMQEKYFIQSDDFTVSSILKGYCYKGNTDKGFKYYTECRNKDIFPDFFGFMHLINGFYSKGRMEEARGVIREMLTHMEIEAIVNKYGNEIYNESLVSLLLVACDQGRIKEVINILREVGSMYNLSLKELKEGCVDLKFDDHDLKNGEISKREFFSDDFEEYYSIMKELCKKGEIKEVNSLINAMIINSEV